MAIRAMIVSGNSGAGWPGCTGGDEVVRMATVCVPAGVSSGEDMRSPNLCGDGLIRDTFRDSPGAPLIARMTHGVPDIGEPLEEASEDEGRVPVGSGAPGKG